MKAQHTTTTDYTSTLPLLDTEFDAYGELSASDCAFDMDDVWEEMDGQEDDALAFE